MKAMPWEVRDHWQSQGWLVMINWQAKECQGSVTPMKDRKRPGRILPRLSWDCGTGGISSIYCQPPNHGKVLSCFRKPPHLWQCGMALLGDSHILHSSYKLKYNYIIPSSTFSFKPPLCPVSQIHGLFLFHCLGLALMSLRVGGIGC